MAAPDRIQRLRAQRELIAAHLAWLDGEIEHATEATDRSSRSADDQAPSTASLESTTSEKSNAPPSLTASSPLPPISSEDSNELIEELVQEYQAADPPLSKTGCWVIFCSIIAVAVGGALIAIHLIYP